MLQLWGGAFSSVKPYYSDTGITPYTQFGSIIYGSSVTTIQYTNLTPNQRYWFSMTPYNGSNYDGTSNTDVYVDDANCVTLANITEFTNSSDPTESEISVKWSGTYSNVTIAYYLNSTNTLVDTSTNLTSSDTPKTFSNLNSNTEYKFIITPYNILNVAGTQTTFIKSTPVGKLLNYTGSSFTSNNNCSQIYTFTSDTNFTIKPTSNITGNVIIVGGGGGGGVNYGSDGGGGGGAGKVGYGKLTFKPNKTYYITIGSGGSANSDGGTTIIKEDTTKIAEAVGGGHGGYGDGTGTTIFTGGNGGSGGGATGWGPNQVTKGSATSNSSSAYPTIAFYGNDGGNAGSGKGGSGGGAGAAGDNDKDGGVGKQFSYVSSSFFGGGGAPGVGQNSTKKDSTTPFSGGSGGGGSGGLYNGGSKNGSNGEPNTGGGGGGGGGAAGSGSPGLNQSASAGSGGSGIVIIAFDK